MCRHRCSFGYRSYKSYRSYIRWTFKKPREYKSTMLIVMKADATDSQVEAVLRVIEELGFKGHPMPGATRTAIGITGNQGAVDPSHFENLAGVADAIRVSKPYKLISLDLRPEKTVVRVGAGSIGGADLMFTSVH